MSDDAYQAALRGGLSAAMPKDTTKTTAAKQSKPPIEESAGVKAAKALLEKLDNGSDDDKDVLDSAAVNDALKKGLAAAAGLDKVSKENKEKMKAQQEKSVADQAKSWLEGKTQEEKDALIRRAVSGGLANAASKPTAPKKKKVEEEEEDDAEPLPSNVEAWLKKMKEDAEADDADLSAAVKAALAGGASAAAISSTSTGGKSKTEKEKVYSIPPGVKSWIEASQSQSATKWEEEAGETVTNAMYGGGIASMMAAKKKAEAQQKKKVVVVAEEDIIPKSIQKWLDKNDVVVLTPEDGGDEPMKETSLHIPPEVAKFLAEAKKEHSAEEATAAFSELLQ
jgi:hypothetical protein